MLYSDQQEKAKLIAHQHISVMGTLSKTLFYVLALSYHNFYV